MEQHKHCQCNELQQQQQLQKLQKYQLEQLRQYGQHICPSAFGHVGPIENVPVGNIYNKCCEWHHPTPPNVDQNQNKNEQNQNGNKRNLNENVNQKLKIVMHKINVDNVTIGKPRGKESCQDIKLIRNPENKCICSIQQCPTHQQQSGNKCGDKAMATAPATQYVQLTDTSKGEPKEVPLKFGLLNLPKRGKNQDSEGQGQNVKQLIAPVCSNISANEDEPQQTAIVVLKPRNEEEGTGSLDMLVVCKGKDSKKTDEIEQQISAPAPEAPKNPHKKCRKKGKRPPPPHPGAFGPPPPILCTRSVCCIA